MIGLKLKPKCPNCGGFMYYDNDIAENYLVCACCAREYNLDMTSRRMTPQELKNLTGISLQHAMEYDRIELG